jgi:hypothetical protein
MMLIEGDPMEPSSTDLILQRETTFTKDGKAITRENPASPPSGDGWRLLTGNYRMNSWARCAYRHEVEEDAMEDRSKANAIAARREHAEELLSN